MEINNIHCKTCTQTHHAALNNSSCGAGKQSNQSSELTHIQCEYLLP